MKKMSYPLIICLVLLGFSRGVLAFSDVKSGYTHFVAITNLEQMGIINGYEDGSYKPDNRINRAEALKMLTLASGVFDQQSFNGNKELKENVFVDVKKDKWFAPYIFEAKEKGIVQGHPDGTFKPEDNVNIAEALKMYLECFDNLEYPSIEDNLFADTPANAWFSKYFAYAKTHGLLDVHPNNHVYPANKVSRGYLAEIIYRNIKSTEGFEFGKATWYGKNLHGNKTASGETFDMNALTAAHKTLPFGTIVKVTNLANNKSVNIKINDRGPYGPGRVLDLSSGAFKKIASLGSGIINVQFEVVK